MSLDPNHPTSITVCDGKYTIIYDFRTGQSECLRYGEKWRDLCGDKMVLAMFDEIVAIRQQRDLLREVLESLLEESEEPPERNCSCHISPPCNDCVEYAGWRGIHEQARALNHRNRKEQVMNTNPDTGIRYGIVAANSLDSDIINGIQSGVSLEDRAAETDLRERVESALSDYLSLEDREEIADRAVELMFASGMSSDEQTHEFDIDGVKGRTTWLGGALHVWVFESPVKGMYSLCSPCCPNAGDLDSPEAEGEECYDVPENWRVKE